MRLDKKDMVLYAVTDRHWLNGESLYSQVEKALKGGATFIQLREKNLGEEEFLAEAKEIARLCKSYHVPFVINDNVEIAKKVDADGVHVGQSDMEALDVRKTLGEDKIIGVTAKTVEQALKAQAHGADYLGVGAVFGTTSKADATKLDHKVLKEICETVDIPVVAIGGITGENVTELAGNGICGVAVISAVFGQPDIEQRESRGYVEMILFTSDYTEGAHPRIIEKLAETNMEQTVGYGEDPYCEEAREAIKKVCEAPEADVHFLVGGTQTNFTVISSILRPFQGVLCADSGHINVHETGAVEATGHKVLALPSKEGKITGQQIKEYYDLHWSDESREHIVQPKMVYISHPTEVGTLYTKNELENISTVCKECGLYLFLDGARMGYGLMAPGTDVTLPDIAKCCDVFYIGGTKVGALFGEAVVITNPCLKQDFRYCIKQKGGMLAKGRLLGVQFLELFKDGLYFEISKHAIDMAMLLKDGLKEKGYEFFMDSDTNQQFIIVEDAKLQEIRQKYGVTYQERYDETHSVIRLCTSWATKEENVKAFLQDM